MASNPRGLSLPSTLIKATTPKAPPAEVEPEADVEQAEDLAVEVEERAGESRPAAKSRRRKTTPSADRTSKRGLHLSDAVWERLQLEAIRKRTTVSAIANDLLDRNLARLRIERDA